MIWLMTQFQSVHHMNTLYSFRSIEIYLKNGLDYCYGRFFLSLTDMVSIIFQHYFCVPIIIIKTKQVWNNIEVLKCALYKDIYPTNCCSDPMEKPQQFSVIWKLYRGDISGCSQADDSHSLMPWWVSLCKSNNACHECHRSYITISYQNIQQCLNHFYAFLILTLYFTRLAPSNEYKF